MCFYLNRITGRYCVFVYELEVDRRSFALRSFAVEFHVLADNSYFVTLLLLPTARQERTLEDELNANLS